MLYGICLIIYDLDGTLIDSTEAIIETFNRVVGELGESTCPPAVIEEMIGLPLSEMFRRVLPVEKHDRVQECWTRYIEIYDDLSPRKTKVLPGVSETLSYFSKKGLKQSVATTKRSDVASRLLGKLGLLGYFNLVLGINDVSSPKPAPDIIKMTLNCLCIKPQEAVFVEDTTIGLKAGKGANVHTVGVTTGTHDRSRLKTLDPDYIIDGIEELTTIIEVP